MKSVLSDKTNKPVSRAKLIRSREYRCRANFSSPSLSPTSADAGISKKRQKVKSEQEENDNENRTRIAWARVKSAKALQVSSKVASRLGRIEELTKTLLDLLVRMRPANGEINYANRMDVLLASLPNPTSCTCEVLGDPDDNKEVQVLAATTTTNDDKAMSIGLVVIITTLVAEGWRFESRGVALLYSVSSLVL